MLKQSVCTKWVAHRINWISELSSILMMGMNGIRLNNWLNANMARQINKWIIIE